VSGKTSEYRYELPEALIAQTPAEPRDGARLLVVDRQTGALRHEHFFDLPRYLKKGDVLVLNHTRVLPARLHGIKTATGAAAEALLLKRLSLTEWEVMLRPLKRLPVGTVIKFSDDLSATVAAHSDDGLARLTFAFAGVFEDILRAVGEMPLPPYIKRKADPARYQTVYAKVDGSSAAPTAGLHFTPRLLDDIRAMGVEIAEVQLNVGLGTFRPVKVEDVAKHVMHSEYYVLGREAADALNRAKSEGRRIVAVGTTSVRVLETCARDGFPLKAQAGDTRIFIYPPYEFKATDALITNFHLPESTLLMLVSAFMGREQTLAVYAAAVQARYRFFSFGDAMLIS
jgi:S-adenosylmethionine:tRNA ribosyltransferase-isomerase